MIGMIIGLIVFILIFVANLLTMPLLAKAFIFVISISLLYGFRNMLLTALSSRLLLKRLLLCVFLIGISVHALFIWIVSTINHDAQLMLTDPEYDPVTQLSPYLTAKDNSGFLLFLIYLLAALICIRIYAVKRKSSH